MAATAKTNDPPAEAPAESRVQRKRGKRVERILEETAGVIGRQGISRFSLEDVAERLDVTKGSLYHYFPSKDELVISAIETLGYRILADLRAVVDGSQADAPGTLRALLEKQISVVVWEYPASIELFTLREPADAARRVKAVRKAHDELFRSVIERGLDEGTFRVASTYTSLECIYSAISMAPLWIRGSRAATKRLIADLIDTLLMTVGVLPTH